jgi:hypothetical protein
MTAPGGLGPAVVDPAIVLNAKLTIHARLLYAVLCCLADEGRTVERSKPELMDDSGLSRATLHRAMAELIEAGIVEVHSSINSDGGTRTNLYHLHEGGLTQRLPQVQTETPGVSHRDPLEESPAQTPVSHRDPGGSHTETGEGVSEGDGGSLIYKKGVPLDTEAEVQVNTHTSPEHIHHAEPPAPEGSRPMRTMRNFNTNPQSVTAATTPKRARRGPTKSTDDPDFDRAWALYAHPVDKAQGRKAWTTALKKTDAETIIGAIPAYVAVSLGKNDPERRGADWVPRRKNFATWLNNSGWTEDYTPAQPQRGRAGADAHDPAFYVDHTKQFTIQQLIRNGPTAGEPDLCFAWYYHWNHAEQATWTREQMLATGNTPEDVNRLMTAYRDGIDQALYREFLDAFQIDQDGANR